MNEKLEKQLAFIIEIDKAKCILRQSLLTDASRRENDAEHSWHLAMMAMVLEEYAQPGTDIGKVIKMSLVHDLVEIYAGDTFAYDEKGNLNKAQREEAAANKLYSLLPSEQGAQMKALWHEFDNMETPEARYAAALDRLQPLIANYLTQGHTWKIGLVRSAQVYERMEPIRLYVPALWDYADELIRDSIKKGFLPE